MTFKGIWLYSGPAFPLFVVLMIYILAFIFKTCIKPCIKVRFSNSNFFLQEIEVREDLNNYFKSIHLRDTKWAIKEA